MQEVCFCGRRGEIEDREPVVTGGGARAFRCPGEACGHVDDLRWLPDNARRRVLRDAERRRLSAA